MNKRIIQQKVTDLHAIMNKYKHELGGLEKELFMAISDYQKSLEEEKIKELKATIASSHD